MEDDPGDVSEPVGRGNRQEGLERRTGMRQELDQND